MDNQPTTAEQLGHRSIADTTATYGKPLTPEVVSAILRDPDSPLYPSRICVFCDECGTEFSGEYMVSEEQTSVERLEVARGHMRTKGWQCDQTGDFCPLHKDRADTPDRTNGDGSTTITIKRACNGCGVLLGDADDRDADDDGNITDVRGECTNCKPLVELEKAGARTWHLTPRSFGNVVGQIDRLRPWIFTKGYWQEVDGKLQVVGLRVGENPDRVVAFFGDWLIRHADGTWSVHKAPASDGA